MRANRVKGALIVAAGTLCAASVALAGNGVGSVFNLGQANTVNGATALSGTTNGNQLGVVNLSTAAAARGVAAYTKNSSTASAAFQNAGGGPALALGVDAGKQPFTVASTKKVISLGVDQLDGVEASAFATRYGRTVVLHPTGSDAVNGTVLRNTLAAITTASPSNPWLVKLEPGAYDVGTTRLILKPDVTVEGSDEGSTTITGGGGCIGDESITVQSPVRGALRSLTVLNTGGCIYATAIWSDGPLDLREVTARASGGATTRAIELTGTFKHLTDVTADGVGSGSGFAAGISIDESTTPASPHVELVRVDARARGASAGHNAALLNSGSNVVVRRSRLRTDAVSDPAIQIQNAGRVLALWTLLGTGGTSIEEGGTYKCGANYDANGVYLC